MNQSSLDARVRFAGNCIRGAARSSPAVATELRASARAALADVRDAAAADANDGNPQTQAYARVLLRGLH